MWTWNVEDSGSLVDGVKIIVLPCQWNEPGTAGVIENARSAVSVFTSSLKSTLIEVPSGRGRCRCGRADADGIGRRDAIDGHGVVENGPQARRLPTSADSSRRNRPLVSQRQSSGSSTGQDDSTAPILANL